MSGGVVEGRQYSGPFEDSVCARYLELTSLVIQDNDFAAILGQKFERILFPFRRFSQPPVGMVMLPHDQHDKMTLFILGGETAVVILVHCEIPFSCF